MKGFWKIACAAAVAFAATQAPTYAQAEDEIPRMNLRFAHFAPAAWGSAQADKLFAEEIEKRTDGRVKVQIFWSGALGGPGEIMDLVSSGAVDMGTIIPAYHPAQWPMWGLINSLPLTWEKAPVAMDIQAGLLKENESVVQEMKDNGVWAVLLHGLPPYRLQCTKPIRTVEDLDGVRVRTFGEWPPYMFEKLGATPVNIPLGDVYEALQRGSIDCGYNPTENAGFLKLHEVAKYWSDINLGAIAAYTTFISWDNYQNWPPELLEVIRESAKVAMKFEKGNFERLEKEHLAEAQEHGVEYVHFEEQDRLYEIVPNLLDQWEETTCERGRCEDAEKMVSDVRRFMAEHE
jgi:TRAP-type C4-dicarboxylate transport system substrate-binding protein